MPNKVLDTIKSNPWNPWETSLIGGATLLCLCIALLWLKHKGASEPARTTEDLTAEELGELLIQYTPLPGVLIAMVQSYADTALSQQQEEPGLNATSGRGDGLRIDVYLTILKAAAENNRLILNAAAENRFIQNLTSVLSGAPLPRNYEDQHNIQNRPN